jgi:hypothetical protein
MRKWKRRVYLEEVLGLTEDGCGIQSGAEGSREELRSFQKDGDATLRVQPRPPLLRLRMDLALSSRFTIQGGEMQKKKKKR